MHRKFLQTAEEARLKDVLIELDVALQDGHIEYLKRLQLLLGTPLVGIGIDNDIFG